MYSVHDPFLMLYFFANFVIAHRHPIVALLSALVECSVYGFPSIGPSPCMFVDISAGLDIFHADVPLPSFTDASDPPIRLPCLRDLASSAILPSSFISPVILLHIAAWLLFGGFFYSLLLLI